MNKTNITKFFKNVGMSVSKHSPEILTGIGIAGMVATTVLAVKATPKALKLIEEKKREEHVEKLTPVETVKTTWKCYIPAVVTGVSSVACLIGARSVDARRNAALAAAYKLSETAFTEYREKVVQTIGEKKEQAVQEAVDRSRIESNPVSKNEVIITEKGNTLCYDSISGRYFKSDMDLIRKAENEINRRMVNDFYVSLNDFYDEIGLDHIDIGDELGWNIDNKLIEIRFGSHIADDGTPCIVVKYSIAPKYNYDSLLG